MSTENPSFAGISRLGSTEIRVLGCLLEKQRTTPDAYPLSLNALRLACNQSTNRDPVVEYDDAVLRDALHRLERRGYTRLASGAGSRAPKYRHLLAEALPMAEDEHAVICVLMLRGPQTPGELKQRTERMHMFADLGGVHETLERLIGRELVAVQERRPGQKEERYVQLLGSGEEATPSAGPGPSIQPEDVAVPAVGALEERVARLEREVAQLRAALGDRPDVAQEADRPGVAHGADRPEVALEVDRPEVAPEADQPEETLEWS
ncbi:MAG: YceH family protein [Solirubrobacterales bacterium]